MSRILVTGGMGFIGRHLTERLLAKGEEPWVTTYRQDDPTLWPEALRGVPIVPMDLQDPEQVRRAVERVRPERVYHLAAQAYPLRSWKDPSETYRINVLGTVHLFDALREHPPPEGILLASSGAIYGTRDRAPIGEDAPLLPTNPYGVSKACQDMIAFQYATNYGLRILRARLFGTTGPGKTGDAPGDFSRQIARAEANGGGPRIKVGNLAAERDISDVRDVLDAFELLLAKGDPGVPVNVGAGRTYRIGEILEILRKAARIPIEPVEDPALLRPTDEPVVLADTTRLRSLGYVPRHPIATTLTDSLDYWRAHPDRPAA